MIPKSAILFLRPLDQHSSRIHRYPLGCVRGGAIPSGSPSPGFSSPRPIRPTGADLPARAFRGVARPGKPGALGNSPRSAFKPSSANSASASRSEKVAPSTMCSVILLAVPDAFVSTVAQATCCRLISA